MAWSMGVVETQVRKAGFPSHHDLRLNTQFVDSQFVEGRSFFGFKHESRGNTGGLTL